MKKRIIIIFLALCVGGLAEEPPKPAVPKPSAVPMSAVEQKPSAVSKKAGEQARQPGKPAAKRPSKGSAIKIVDPPPFVIPKEAEILANDASGKTWRMNGRIKGELADCKKSLYVSILREKFDFKHETALDKEKTHLLSMWVKGKEVLLLLVWTGDGYTYFSWGTYTE